MSKSSKAAKKTASATPEVFTLDMDKLVAMVEADKKEALKPEAVDKSLHALALTMFKAEGAHDKAINAVYATFKFYCLEALPIIARLPAHTAAILDLKAVYGEARKPAAIQRITMLNNMRTIAYGKVASRDTPAQAAQGVEVVLEALNACTGLPALKSALSALKTVTHKAQGVAKVTASGEKAKAEKAVQTAKEEKPANRTDAISAACRMLAFISETYLQAGTDSDLVLEVADLIEHLKRKAA